MHLRSGEKGGSKVGKTKRGKGTKPMIIAEVHGLPLAVHRASASPHEVILVDATLDETVTLGRLRRLIGDRAYNSDPLDEKLAQRGIELIALGASTVSSLPVRTLARCVATNGDGRSSGHSPNLTSSNAVLPGRTAASNVTLHSFILRSP
jgi:hypothetical protein